LKAKAERGELDPGFSYRTEHDLLVKLDKRTFKKIWYFTESYALDKGKKIYSFPRTIEMLYKSPYMNFCRALTVKNPKLEFYYHNYQKEGTMNSDLIEFVLNNYEDFNFSKVSERLLFAVHYFTVNSRDYK
jgi:hypothetical protein